MYTYIIESKGLTKIGRAINVDRRMKQYATHNPHIELLKVIEGDYEQFLQDVFSQKKISTEWFSLTKEDVANIDMIIEAGTALGKEREIDSDLAIKILLRKHSKHADLSMIIDINNNRLTLNEKSFNELLKEIENKLRYYIKIEEKKNSQSADNQSKSDEKTKKDFEADQTK